MALKKNEEGNFFPGHRTKEPLGKNEGMLPMPAALKNAGNAPLPCHQCLSIFCVVSKIPFQHYREFSTGHETIFGQMAPLTPETEISKGRMTALWLCFGLRSKKLIGYNFKTVSP